MEAGGRAEADLGELGLPEALDGGEGVHDLELADGFEVGLLGVLRL